MSCSAERRSDSRYRHQWQVCFNSVSEDRAKRYLGETTNVSQSGFFMQTDARLSTGSILSLAIRIPGFGTLENQELRVHCSGRVIHHQVLPCGQQGYGVLVSRPLGDSLDERNS
jgi:PilZ domain